MLFIKDTPIDQILSMKEMIDAIEDALKDFVWGAALICRGGVFTIPIA